MEGLLALIERERGGEAIDRPLVKGLLRMFGSLGTYAEAFHEPFIQVGVFWKGGGRTQPEEGQGGGGRGGLVGFRWGLCARMRQTETDILVC